MMAGDEQTDDTYDQLVSKQRLKAAIHHTTGLICEEVEEDGMTFDRQFIAMLSEAAFKYCQTMATDLELFARHAKRSMITADDVKLLARKSPALLQHLTEQLEKETTKKRTKK